MIFGVGELSVFESGNFSELSIKFLNSLFSIDKSAIINRVDRNAFCGSEILNKFSFDFVQTFYIDVHFLGNSLGLFQSVGGVNQHSVMFIRVNHVVDVV